MRTGVLYRSAVVFLLGLTLWQSNDVRAGSITDDGRVRGRADAPITLIEYARDAAPGSPRLKRSTRYGVT